VFNKIDMTVMIILFALGAGIYHFQIKQGPGDKGEYQHLIAETTKEKPQTHPITQIRKGVQKEIWTVRNGQRALFRLNSEDSKLSILPKNGILDICEKLHNLEGCMQEEIIPGTPSVQEIRTLKAENGTYFFPSHQFISDAVTLKFYRIVGSEFPTALLNSKPYLRGNVFDVAFGAQAKSLTFTADYLKADLDPKQLLEEDL